MPAWRIRGPELAPAGYYEANFLQKMSFFWRLEISKLGPCNLGAVNHLINVCYFDSEMLHLQRSAANRCIEQKRRPKGGHGGALGRTVSEGAILWRIYGVLGGAADVPEDTAVLG